MAKPTILTGPPSSITPDNFLANSILTSDGGHPCELSFQYYRRKTEWPPYYTPWEGPFTSYHAYSKLIATPLEWYSVKYIAMARNEEGYAGGNWVLLWLRNTPPEVYGIPWLIINQQVSNADLQITWVCTTDIGCHLTIRVSDKPPYKASELHEKRGTVYYHGTKVKFDWTHEYTQQESGDTLVHTFIFTVPEYNRTYWWYARGTVDGEISSSRSPFFNYYVYKFIPPPGLINAQSNCFRSDDRVYAGLYQGVTFFTPAHTYRLTTINLKLSKRVNPSALDIDVRAAEAHLPIGSNLCSRTLNGSDLPLWDGLLHSCGTPITTILDFYADEVILQPSKEYVITLKSPKTSFPPSQVVIGGTLSPYDQIYHIYSYNYGGSWLVSTGQLPFFQVYGIQQD